MIEVDVRNQWHLDLLSNLAKGLCGLHTGYRNTDNVGTGLCDGIHLGYRRGHVTGFGVGHALHADWRIAAHGNRTHMDLSATPALDR